MGVTVSLPLFGEPGRALEEGSDLTGRQLRELAAGLNERLERAAAAVDTLAAAGWTARVALFDAILYHPHIETARTPRMPPASARRRPGELDHNRGCRFGKR